MKDTRICVVQGKERVDVPLAPSARRCAISGSAFSGDTTRWRRATRFWALAEQCRAAAQKIVEPSEKDILEAVKAYVACRRLMEAEGCEAFAMECLTHIAAKTAPPPCLGFSRMLDEGIVAACQADWPAAISLRLSGLLLGRPGFMNNTCVNTAANTRVGAHCTSATRLAGPDQKAQPFILRSHSETNLGVAVQVLWPTDREITIMKFSHPDWWKNPKAVQRPAGSMVLGSGRVLRNIDVPPSGGCRTSLEVKVDGVEDPRSSAPCTTNCSFSATTCRS